MFREMGDGPQKVRGERMEPDGRAEGAELQRQIDHFSRARFTRQVLDALPSLLAILNGRREMVYANQPLLDLAGLRDEDLLRGLRPGEAFACATVGDSPGGCGEAEACATCGALLAVLAGLSGQPAVKECRLARRGESGPEALDLLVHATPLEYEGERFTIFALSDVSHEKRRGALERIFFHDVLNVAGSIRGLAELLTSGDIPAGEDIFRMIHRAADQVVEEIEAQRMLTMAEGAELEVRPSPAGSRQMLEQAAALYRNQDLADERELHIDKGAQEVVLTTDPVLLLRVLGNLVKNALEATAPGERVTLDCRRGGDSVEFRVHNPGEIPRQAQLQIFHRSFSTKGRGRGLGTYSVRLLTERYLGGRVSFESSSASGTTFSIIVPLRLP